MPSPCRTGVVGFSFLVLFLVFPMSRPAAAGERDEPPVFVERLPDTWTYCALTDRKSKLLESLKGRPSAIFVTDAARGPDNPLGLLVAELQREYFFWFTWAGLLTGEASQEDLGAVHARSPFRIERCFTDPGGEVMRELGVPSLPTLVLVNEDGYIVDRIGAGDAAREKDIMAEVDGLVRSSMLKGHQVRDFKLPELRTGTLKTLLDVAGRDSTMLLYLHSGSPRCLRELQVLSTLQGKFGESTSLVAIFREPTPASAIQEVLDGSAIEPDVLLHDPRTAREDAYSSPCVPLLVVAGREGTIIFSRKGFEPEESRNLVAELETLLRREAEKEEGTPFQEARRIHGEALQYLREGDGEMAAMFLKRVLELLPDLSTVHCLLGDTSLSLGRNREAARYYGRCVAANPRAYDLPQVREKLRALGKTP